MPCSSGPCYQHIMQGRITERKITAIAGNTQRLDGGAMFGNAPRALWTRWAEPDDDNRIPLACRAMLIEDSMNGVEKEAITVTKRTAPGFTSPAWECPVGFSMV